MRKPSSTANVRTKRPKSRRKTQGGRRKDSAGALWIYGSHAVSAALRNPARELHELLTAKDAVSRLAGTLNSLPSQRTPPVHEVPAAEIEKLLPPGAVHQGLALRAERLPAVPLETGCAPRAASRNVVVVLDHVTDPHNVGAILRSAAAFGARALVLTQAHAPAESGSLAKAASGALDTLPYVQVANLARALDQLAGLGYWRVGLASQAESTLPEADVSGNIALVLGAEGGGLRRLTTTKCDQLVRLPTQPNFPDLNVSNAAAVALYEIARKDHQV